MFARLNGPEVTEVLSSPRRPTGESPLPTPSVPQLHPHFDRHLVSRPVGCHGFPYTVSPPPLDCAPPIDPSRGVDGVAIFHRLVLVGPPPDPTFPTLRIDTLCPVASQLHFDSHPSTLCSSYCIR